MPSTVKSCCISQYLDGDKNHCRQSVHWAATETLTMNSASRSKRTRKQKQRCLCSLISWIIYSIQCLGCLRVVGI